ncbi:(d)CMP kinase [Haloechinothrix salitolerans]|uniref:Cytidylate kinase n=1 Tax=Haloechinothrix salitolerans TaxID=926830 RepID=A0ABW2C274_9PSEU
MDGPSGTGKTTVARKLANRLGAGYLDTGAMYRAITLAALRSEVDVAEADAVTKAAKAAELEVGTDPNAPVALLDGEDVAAEIRGDQVTSAVSAVAAVPAVRDLLVGMQRRIIERVLAERGGIVVEGRDIGTVVAPDAPLKIFLTASADVRAARRLAQDSAAGREANHVDVLRSVDRRDRLDSTRATNPMRPADDAVEFDTSDLGIEGVVTSLCELAEQRGIVAERGAPT